MPRKYIRKKPTGRRRGRYAKRKKYKIPSLYPRDSRIPRTIGFPATFKTRLRYTETLQLNQAVVGVPNLYKFTTAGLYDPNVSGTGHQPKFYDEFASLYQRYIVRGSKITVRFSTKQTSGTSTPPMIVGIVRLDATDGTSSFSSIEAVMETRRARYRQISASMEARPTTITHTYSQRDYERKQNNRIKEAVASVPINTDPTNTDYYYVFSSSLDSGATHPTLFAFVTIDYAVDFMDRAQQAQS